MTLQKPPTKDPGASETLREGKERAGVGLAPLKPHLFVVLEADRPAAGGARYALEGVEEVLIGRGKERKATLETMVGRRRLVVRVPGPWMSSAHVRIVLERDGWVAEDTGSKNGTLLGGARIRRAPWREGELLEAGHTLFALRPAMPTPKAATLDAETSAAVGLLPGLETLCPELGTRFEALSGVLRSNVPVLLLGESGTGKEVVARALHGRSGRDPFVAVNCGALPIALVESLLFGHVRGSFSSALRDEPGLVRSADGGTLFLDEIGDLPLAAQASLLRVLQEREVLPVGGTRPFPVDLRVICATHRPLDLLVARGAFRADLLARLDGFRHMLPPLRERVEDLGLLVALLLRKLVPGREGTVSFSPAAAQRLACHTWPSNVRELEQALARALALSLDGRVDEAALSLNGAGSVSSRPHADAEADARIHERLIAELARHRGNVSQVARSMGKARMQVQRWMQRFGVDAADYRKPR
jgi:transcriptional regulator of acetoin/glycerol metabolism